LAEEDSNSEQEDTIPQVETVLEYEEEAEEDTPNIDDPGLSGLSEQDEALTDGDSLSCGDSLI
jgi:hypothetical protein